MRVRLLALALILGLVPSVAFGQFVEVNNGGTFTWAVAPWVGGSPPNAGQTALMRGGGTINIGTGDNISVGGILDGWAGNYNMVMTDGTFTVGSTLGDGLGVFGLTVGESGVGTFSQSGGIVNAPVLKLGRFSAGSNGTYSLNAGGTLNAGVIAEGLGSGTFNFNGGTLKPTASSATWFGAGITANVQAGGAVIDTQGFDATVQSALLNGGGGLTKNGAGVLRLVANNTYTGPTAVNGGTLQIGNGVGAAPLGAGNYSVASNAELVFNGNANNNLFTVQSISGAGDVVFRGQQNGYFTFRGGGQYTGTLSNTGRTIVNLDDNPGNAWYQGTLWLEKDDVLSHATVLDLQSGKIYTRNQTGSGLTIAGLSGNAGTFVTTDSVNQKWNISVPTGQTYTYAGVIGADGTGTGNNNIALTKSGAGVQILSGNNTYTGGTTVSGGFLTLGVDNALPVGGVLTFAPPGVRASLNMNGKNQTLGGLVAASAVLFEGDIYNNDGNPTSTLTLDVPFGQTYTYANQIGPVVGWRDVAVVKDGLGTQIFTGNSLHTGGTTINGGTLQLGDGTGHGWVEGNILNNAELVFKRGPGAASDFNGVISGTGNVTQAGGDWLSFERPQTYQGTTTLSGTAAGVLYLENYQTTGNVLPATTVLDLQSAGVYMRNDNQTLAGLKGSGFYNATNLGSLNKTLTLDVGTGNTYTYSGALSQTGSTLALLKDGLGTQILTGLNTYTGLTTVSRGTLQIGNGEALNNVGQSSFSVADGAKLVFNRNTAPTDFTTQSISGQGDVEFRGQQNGYFRFQGYSGTLSNSGRTIVNLDDNPGNQWFQGVLWLEKDDVLSHASVLDIQSGKVYTRNQTVNGLTVAGLSGNAGTFVTTDSANQKWNISVATGESYDYAGTIGADEHGNNSIILTISGPGEQILSGNNTYAGTTNITGGTLLVNGTHSGGGGYSVQSGATLGGTGFIGATVTVADYGILAPGASGNTLTITDGNDLLLNASSILNFELDAPDSLSNDLVALSGAGADLRLDGLLNVFDLGSFQQGRYLLFTYDGALTDNGVTIDSLPGGYSTLYSWIDTDILGEVYLQAVVPEPSTLAIWALGLLGLAACRRRRRG